MTMCRDLNLLKIFYKSCLGLASTLATAGFMAVMLLPAAAQEPQVAQEPQTVLDTLEDIVENRSGDYFRNRSLLGQASFITGIGGFPENRLAQDTESLSGAYNELLILQTQNTPTLRVPDLPNPYTSSVQLLLTAEFDSRIDDSELNFEPIPR
ncbi:hypothetical protein S7335_4025 [Synechococcus sp. PCC 7335]|uniref:hypothetical protein n=1 Tax=Synechococcus sp. (strain ATCC 29403 / PCC 7335) TaxID=91464 RepID=UPI00017EBFD8|nr:hypothetical protein [Synechococcus sp. PCC 7335]EDX86322.1 hypothetical protein S7335_4025 [Synechococcus sp. PCC 7335]